MFIAILPILINFLCRVETIPVISETNCSYSKLGCNCQNIEVITKESIESCCKPDIRILLITGLDVRNISINVTGSPCSGSFQNLLIRDTGIVSFNSRFYGLDNVTIVYIEKNQNLSNFNKLYFSEISQNIDTIMVEYNSIRSISAKTFAKLDKLVSLKLSENKIGFIEDHSFVNLKNLTLLYLNNNLLTILNSEIFLGLEKLKVLSLLNNFLMELKQDTFKYLTNLQFLYLSLSANSDFTGFNNLPNNVFFDMKKLKYLNMTLKINNLTSLTFYGLNDLELLDLQGNQLTVIVSGTFQQIPKIKTISLAKNQIRCLLPDTFRSLPRLTSIDLSFNDLSYISSEVFSDLSTLQTLELAENNIYVIENNAFVGLKSLLVFKLNIIHGKAKNELQTNFRKSPLAQLSNNTKIIGLKDYFGIFSGLSEPPEISSTTKPILKDLEMKKSYCPVAGNSDRDWVDSTHTGSRKYLLIIVGICVVFLLVAFAIIMSYRAWSKRKMSDLSYEVEEQEKQEMLVNKPCMINGRIDNNPHVKSTRKSLNGSYIPDVSVDKIEETTDSFKITQVQQSNIPASSKPTTCPLSNERNQSDDESALTPLGVL